LIEDPHGNSAILGDEVERTELSDEEAEQLEVPEAPGVDDDADPVEP
jgi:C4-type Zn-finger protein